MPSVPARASTFFRPPTPEYRHRLRARPLSECGELELLFSHQAVALPARTAAQLRDLEFKVRRRGRERVFAHGRLTLLKMPHRGSLARLAALRDTAPSEYGEALDVLLSTCDDPAAVFRAGGVLVLEYFELCRSARGSGLGATLGRALLRAVAEKFGASMVMWRPYPLQFLDRLEELQTPEGAAQFDAERKRLVARYRRGWGARPLGRSGWLGLGTGEPRLGIGRVGSKWTLAATEPAPRADESLPRRAKAI